MQVTFGTHLAIVVKGEDLNSFVSDISRDDHVKLLTSNRVGQDLDTASYEAMDESTRLACVESPSLKLSEGFIQVYVV